MIEMIIPGAVDLLEQVIARLVDLDPKECQAVVEKVGRPSFISSRLGFGGVGIL